LTEFFLIFFYNFLFIYLFIFIILISPIFSFKNNYWRIKREWEEEKNKNIKSFLSHQEIFREERWQLPLENNQNNFNIKRYNFKKMFNKLFN